MVLDWFGRSHDVADLIARKKYSKAIEVMRAQFKERPPGVETRLQFVDVLILAGRGKEAVPVLIGLADELAAGDQVTKAIGLLKRVEQIEPQRRDVEERLAGLVKKEFEAAEASGRWRPAGPAPGIATPGASSKVTFSQRVSFDIEEISDEPPPAPPAAQEPVGDTAAGEEQAPTEAIEAEPTPAAAESASLPSATGPEPAPEAAPEVPAAAASSPEQPAAPAAQPAEVRSEAAEDAGEPESRDPGMTGRIRGAFRRFLSSLPGSEDAPQATSLEHEAELELEPDLEPEIEPEVEVEADVEAEAEVEVEAEAEPEVAAETEPEVEAEISFEPEETAALQPTAEPETAAEVEASVEPEAAEAPSSAEATVEARAPAQPDVATEPEITPEPLSEAAFHGQVLDLIEEVVQRPLPQPAAAAPEPSPDERPVRTRGVAESAQRLLASPLFSELQEAELLAVVRGMRLHTYEAGDVVITEGEPGDSLFILTTGSVRMFVRNPAGHNYEMGTLKEGDFFGELSSLSGRPRTGTVVAAGHTELLELDRQTVERIARTKPRVRETLENVYIQRASSPEAAAIRAVPVEPGSRQRAIEVLEAYFGESRWDPRMRLRLADLLVKAGKQEEAVPLLVGLADDLDRAGYPEKAIAILKKIERIRKRNIEVVNLAPLKKKKKTAEPGPAPARPAPKPAPPSPPGRAPKHETTAENFSNWIVDVVRDAVAPPLAAAALPTRVVPGYARGLLASPLFEGLTEDELFTMIRELRLLTFDPGDIVITEGEPGQSLFILTAGAVKVSVRSGDGKNVKVAELRAGNFFGEMATVSGKPRTATVTAAQPCELLELDKPALDQIAARHPRVREVLEEIYIARATSPEAARARTGPPPA